MIDYPRITLKPGKEEPLLRQHPWIFSGAIAGITGKVEEGDVVEVFSHQGDYLATGHGQSGSLAVKVISFTRRKIEIAFWKDSLLRAYRLRESLGLTKNPDTNAYRLVNGEGDNLGGLVIDHFAGCLVLQAHSVGMYLALPQITEVLKEIYQERLLSVYSKSADVLSRLFSYEVTDGFFAGDSFPAFFLENGIQYAFDPKGQKTGFFCDQRENRRLAASLARGKKVLDVFCYTGAFSLNALRGGASFVTSVDSARPAGDRLLSNLAMNSMDDAAHKMVVSDARKYLEAMEEEVDMIILDPPAYAKHMSDRSRALQGYRSINASALRKIRNGGLLITFSCSQVVDRASFRSAVTAAAIDTGRSIRILYQLSQAPDHPVDICHPEGEYLKGLVLKVE